MEKIEVKKKDGRLEDFDRNKLSDSVVKSGVPSAEAEKIAVQVESWAQDEAIDGVVSSNDIRIKVLDLLRSVNTEAATSFEAYNKEVVYKR